MPTSPVNQSTFAKNVQNVTAPTSEQVQQINEFLLAIGDYGEIHLIEQHGEQRFINRRLERFKVYCNDNGRSVTSLVSQSVQ
jgi:hypothetical protein